MRTRPTQRSSNVPIRHSVRLEMGLVLVFPWRCMVLLHVTIIMERLLRMSVLLLSVKLILFLRREVMILAGRWVENRLGMGMGKSMGDLMV
jgi:hypothetical protein